MTDRVGTNVKPTERIGRLIGLALIVVAMLLSALSFGTAGAGAADYPSSPEFPDPFDLSAWESCGDGCVVPHYLCPPGYLLEGVGADTTCSFSGKDGLLPPVEEDPRAACPDGQVAVITTQLSEVMPGESDLVCTDVTIELWQLLNGGPSCPDGFTLVESEQPPTQELTIVVLTVTPTPEPPADGATISVADPTFGFGEEVPPALSEPGLPTCESADGETAAPTISFALGELPVVPTCPDGYTLSGIEEPTGGAFEQICVNPEGDTVAFFLAEPPPLECGPNETLLYADTRFARCSALEVPPYPVCPLGYDPGDNGLPLDEGIEPDAPVISECLINAEFAEFRAAFYAENNRYPSTPADFGGAEAAIPTGVVDDAATESDAGAVAAPVPVTPAVAPTSVVAVVPPTVAATPVVVPAVIAAVTAPAPAAPSVAAAHNYGFGAASPAHAASATPAAAKLAHTGADNELLGYAALAMIAAGAVILGTRRRAEIETY